jgi:hypothetical protein
MALQAYFRHEEKSVKDRFTAIKLNFAVADIYESLNLTEYISLLVCYIIKKILVDNAYENVDVRYNYSYSSINSSHSYMDYYINKGFAKFADISLTYLLEKELSIAIEEFRLSDKALTHVLNIKSMIVNMNTLILSFEILKRES